MTLDDPSAWLSLERLHQRHYEEFVLGCRAFEQGWDGGAAEAPAVLLRRLAIAMVYARASYGYPMSRGHMSSMPSAFLLAGRINTGRPRLRRHNYAGHNYLVMAGRISIGVSASTL